MNPAPFLIAAAVLLTIAFTVFIIRGSIEQDSLKYDIALQDGREFTGCDRVSVSDHGTVRFRHNGQIHYCRYESVIRSDEP